MTNEQYTDADWLREKYVDEHMGVREIAELTPVTHGGILHYIRKYQIRRGDEPSKGAKYESAEWLAEKHIEEELTVAEIAERVSIDRRMVQYQLVQNGIEVRSHTDPSDSLDYGDNWIEMRAEVRERDQECQHCGDEPVDRHHHVHHIVPMRLFNMWEQPDPEHANVHRNLIYLCPECHARVECGRYECPQPKDLTGTSS